MKDYHAALPRYLTLRMCLLHVLLFIRNDHAKTVMDPKLIHQASEIGKRAEKDLVYRSINENPSICFLIDKVAQAVDEFERLRL